MSRRVRAQPEKIWTFTTFGFQIREVHRYKANHSVGKSLERREIPRVEYASHWRLGSQAEYHYVCLGVGSGAARKNLDIYKLLGGHTRPSGVISG